MENIKRIKVFVSCTSEIKDEIDSLNLVIEEIIKTSGKRDKFSVESVNWNRDVYSAKASEVQEVVNNQIRDYDLLIGILWKKAGTPTKKFASGTIEEISNAIKNNKNTLVYFNKQSPTDITAIDPDQLKIIQEFKKQLGNDGYLYKEYSSIENFESLIKVDLYNIIHEKILLGKNLTEQTTNALSANNYLTESKYAHVYAALNDDTEAHVFDGDLLELLEKSTEQTKDLMRCTERISSIFTDFNTKLNFYTDKIVANNKLKDNRLRESRLRKIINDVTALMEGFNESLEPQSQIFQELFPQYGNTYTSISIAIADVESDDVTEMKEAALFLRSTIEESLNAYVGLLRSIKGVPPFNRNFNLAKRDTQTIIKTLTKSMLEGLLILDSAKF